MFNKIVGLKDSWTKKAEAPKSQTKKVLVEGAVAPMSEEEQVLFDKYTLAFGLNNEIANILARDAGLSSFYEETLSFVNSPVSLANIVANEVARELKLEATLKFSAKEISELVTMIDEGTISNKIAKQVFEEMAKSGENPTAIVEAQGLTQISDPEKLKPIIDEVIAKNPDNVAKFKAGNTNLFGFFVGQVLKNSGGKANPTVVNELVTEKLKHV